MVADIPGGYMGKVLKVDLSNQRIDEQELDNDTLRKYIGGVGLGAKLVYEKVTPGVDWSDPENRMVWATGPLAGTKIAGSGTFCVVTKGPMIDLAASTQANGFLGAFLKFSGFDAIVLDGAAGNWVYLYIHDDTAELRDAAHLLGKDTWETDDILRNELKTKGLSVFSIGPAGENKVSFAAIAGDKGHVAAHNGVGAVMGSKRLKAIAVARGKNTVPVRDMANLIPIAKELVRVSKQRIVGGLLSKGGTAVVFGSLHDIGGLPVKNYTTNIFPEYAQFDGRALRERFEVKPKPCWACRMNHCEFMKVTDGPYAGYEGEEPEYEQLATFGPIIGQTDPGAAVMLANLGDRLGLDTNECGWVIGWVMECYEKGLLTSNDTDGLEMTWGNVEATIELLRKIAFRDGFGNLLAEGVKRASEHIGGEAAQCAIYTGKGASPRGHDHRASWNEMLDTCLSNTGTIEVWGGCPETEQLGLPPHLENYNAYEVSALNALLSGRRQFEDCLGVCRFCTDDLQLTIDAVNAITGWDINKNSAMEIGKRVINQLRMFNFRHGFSADTEVPSNRYGSAPVDGPIANQEIMPYWDFMVRNYYGLMGWDKESGKPLPYTLQKLGLEHLVMET